MSVVKNRTTQRDREFWDHVESIAKEVRTWPDWMRGGTQVTQEAINHPSHYGGDVPHETYKCLRAWGLEGDALIWNAVKYLSRAGKKDSSTKIQDLEKSVWYITSRIEQLKAEGKDGVR